MHRRTKKGVLEEEERVEFGGNLVGLPALHLVVSQFVDGVGCEFHRLCGYHALQTCVTSRKSIFLDRAYDKMHGLDDQNPSCSDV